MNRFTVLMLFSAWIIGGASCQVTMRLACPWQEGSAVAKVIAAAGETIKTKTGGAVILEATCDVSLAGKETGMVDGLTTGTLDAAMISSEGLIRIDREFAVFDLPFLIVSENELVRVQTQLAADLRTMLEKRGFTLGCWADPGPSYFFTGPLVANPSDLQKLKMAVLLYDSTGGSFLSKFSVPVTPMAINSILPSLSAGAVNGYIGTCTNTARYEWNMKVRYMIINPVRFGTGALIIRKGFLDGLKPAQRETVVRIFRSIGKDLNAALVSDNAAALRNITRLTVKQITFPEGSTGEMLEMAESSWRENAGTLYSPAMLQKIRTILGK